MIPPVPGWAYRLLLLAAVGAGLFAWGGYLGWTKRGDKEANKALIAAHKAEAIRQATEDGWRRAHWDLAYAAEEKRAEREKSTNERIACLLDGSCRVRDRFSCPKVSGAPSVAGEPQAEAGGLLPTDGVFLVQFARDADNAVADLNQCIASYNALRQP